MNISTRFTLALAVWLVTGLGARAFLDIAPGGVVWWCLLGLPGLLVLAVLAAVSVVGVIGLAIGFSRSPGR